MAALGSSFAGGPGLEPVADAAALRSERNYAHLVASTLGASLVDVTASGATTETILHTAQRVRGHRFPPQIEAVDPRLDLDLVTITAGGNDLGYLGSMLRAGIANRLTGRWLTAPLGRRLRGGGASPVGVDQAEATADRLVAVVEAVAVRAPQARILLVDYLTVFGPGTLPSDMVPFTQDELSLFRGTAAALAGAFRAAQRRSKAELVPVSELSESHALDAAEPWVNGLFLRPPFSRFASSLHPNAAGMQAVSEAVLRHLEAA